MKHTIISPRKLIEVALPLDAINAAAKEEKAVPRHGHPQALHYWWARRPLAAARAVIFGQLVHDPEDLWRCQNPGKEPNAQVRGHWTKSRGRLFKIIEDLVLWENTTNLPVINLAKEAIRESWRQTCELNKDHPQAEDLFNVDQMPALHDPFAGGGAIPLEAQRLGLNALASDLNPVATIINKAMIEIPPRVGGKPPVHPDAENPLITWSGTEGLAEDVRRYGRWIHDESERRIGNLYPTIEITGEMAKERPDLKTLVGQRLTVVAWQWARTVKSPNPAFQEIEVPLASTFILSNKEKNGAYVEPEFGNGSYRFRVRIGKPTAAAKGGTSFGKQKGFVCLMSDTPISYEYIREEAIAGRMGQKLMAIIAESDFGRIYLSPDKIHEQLALSAKPQWMPDLKIPEQALGFRVQLYGMQTYSDLFTARQMVAMTTYCDLIAEARDRIKVDGIKAGLSDDGVPLERNGKGALAYAEAVSVYLACALSRLASYNNSICHWNMAGGSVAQIFSRHAIPMSWDFIEVNNLVKMSGNWDGGIEWVAEALTVLNSHVEGTAVQLDACEQTLSKMQVVSTDPPYYDNIGYADLSDFFYVWLRRALRTVYPNLLTTISVPKAEELVATPYRHGTKDKAEQFFLKGMTRAMHRIAVQAHPAIPISIYYAFKQSETEGDLTKSTGWETFLEAVLSSGLSITGTWPMRTEKTGRMIEYGTNALASSIILVCRPREVDAGTISRRQFVRILNETLPPALDAMTRESEGLHSPVAPVDLAQAIIGPGMAIFSSYDSVIEADGSKMSVKTALQLINRFLAEDDFDHDTQFCLHWFQQFAWKIGEFGQADVLARSKGTSVNGLAQAGVVESGGGSVRLLKWSEYPAAWDPHTDSRLPIWEALHHLIRAIKYGGESAAGEILAAIPGKMEAIRQLAYRLYTLCERQGWSEDARGYNELITSWSGIESAASNAQPAQRGLFD